MKKIFVLAFLALTLSGCATTKPGPILDNAAAQRAVYTVESKYKLVLIAANAYVNLPLCGPVKPPCATLSVVRQIQRAQPAARAAIDAAENAVRSPQFGSDVTTSAILAAESALSAFESIVRK